MSSDDASPMMLRVDVEPIITPSQPCNSFGGSTSNGDHPFAGDDGTCKINPEGNSVAQQFANDIQAFFSAFSEAYQVLTEFGYAEGELVNIGQAPFNWSAANENGDAEQAFVVEGGGGDDEDIAGDAEDLDDPVLAFLAANDAKAAADAEGRRLRRR